MKFRLQWIKISSVIGLMMVSLLSFYLGVRLWFPSEDLRAWLRQEFSVRVSTQMQNFFFSPWPFRIGFKTLEVGKITSLEKLPKEVWDIEGRTEKPPVKVSIDELDFTIPLSSLMKSNGSTLDKFDGAVLQANWFGGVLEALIQRVNKSSLIKLSLQNMQLSSFAQFLPWPVSLTGNFSGQGLCTIPDDRKESALTGDFQLHFRSASTGNFKYNGVTVPPVMLGDVDIKIKHSVDTKWVLEPVRISSKGVSVVINGGIDIDRKQLVSSLLDIRLQVTLGDPFLEANPMVAKVLTQYPKGEFGISIGGSIKNPLIKIHKIPTASF